MTDAEYCWDLIEFECTADDVRTRLRPARSLYFFFFFWFSTRRSRALTCALIPMTSPVSQAQAVLTTKVCRCG